MLTYEITDGGGADMSDTITNTLANMSAMGGGILYLPPTRIVCNSAIVPPTTNNVTLVGQGRGATTLDFANTKNGGIVTSGTARTLHNFMRDFAVHGGGAGSGVGIDLTDWDSGALERLRVYNWDTCVRITSTKGGGALRNQILNCIMTNGVNYGLVLTGDQGPHETYVGGGQLSQCGVGLRVDAPTDATTVWRTQMESNGTAMVIAGSRGLYSPRMEGNKQDVSFVAPAAYNLLLTGFFDPTKHSDTSVDAGNGTNRVLPFGHSDTISEQLSPLYIPADPMTLPLAPQLPGADMAISHLFTVGEMRKVTTITWIPSFQAGNVDLAICTNGGTVIATTGSTPVGVAGVPMDVKLPNPVYLGPARNYFVSLMLDNKAAGFYGMRSTLAGFSLMHNEIGARGKTLTTFPFGTQNPVSGASGTLLVPAIRLG